MTNDEFDQMLFQIMDDHPHDPIDIHLKDGRVIHVDQAKMMAVRDGSAVYMGTKPRFQEFSSSETLRIERLNRDDDPIVVES